MQFLRSNTAVIVAVGPFYDKTDGVTIETALTITNERITLVADTDAGSAPTIILDNIAGATAATANDLNYITGNDSGMMQLELAAADVNRVGRMSLQINDAANHVPVFHEYFVLPQAIFDWFTGVIVALPANVTQLGGVVQSLTDLKDFADDAYDPATNKIAGVVLADTLTTYTGNTPQTGDAFARIGATGSGLTSLASQASLNTVDDFLDSEIGVLVGYGAPPTAAVIADTVLDEDMTAHQIQGSLGQAIGDPVADPNTLFKAVVTDATGATVGLDVVAVKGETASMSADIAAIEAQTDDIGAAGAGLSAVPWNAAWDAEVQSEAQDAITASALATAAAVDAIDDKIGVPAVSIAATMSEIVDLFDTTNSTLSNGLSVLHGTAQGAGTGTDTLQLEDGQLGGDDQLNNKIIAIVSGAGTGQQRGIVDSTFATNEIQVFGGDWETPVDNTSVYVIFTN